MDSSTSSELSVLGSADKRRSTRLQATPAVRCNSLISAISTPADRSSGSTPAMQSSQTTPALTSARNTPQRSIDFDQEDATPSKRTGLRRKREEDPKEPLNDSMDEVMKPLTSEERRKWPGWVELESDPVSNMNCLVLAFNAYPSLERGMLIYCFRHTSISSCVSVA